MPSGSSTTLVVLGVEHSAQLLAESYQPAVFRAFFDRVRPDAICVERAPHEFARGNYYEATYEAQHIAVPYARERGIPLYPVDWTLPADDQAPAWGVPDLDAPPFVRPPDDYHAFLRFRDESRLRLGLYFAEDAEARGRVDAWYDAPRRAGERDFARRLGLYRTFMQAMRIKAACRAHPGGVVLVVIGYWHKHDVEKVLERTPHLGIVQPSAFGHPTTEEIEAYVARADLCAVASFNLLGVHSATGAGAWEWLGRVVTRLEKEAPRAETRLLRTRLEVLTGRLPRADALREYAALRASVTPDEAFTFTGVKGRRRVDSYFDPFGNLRVAQRAVLESARERHRLGLTEAAREARSALLTDRGLSPLQRAQVEAYWQAYVAAMD